MYLRSETYQLHCRLNDKRRSPFASTDFHTLSLTYRTACETTTYSNLIIAQQHGRMAQNTAETTVPAQEGAREAPIATIATPEPPDRETELRELRDQLRREERGPRRRFNPRRPYRNTSLAEESAPPMTDRYRAWEGYEDSSDDDDAIQRQDEPNFECALALRGWADLGRQRRVRRHISRPRLFSS
ncbi:hypothetical protein Q7P37_004405 [Cladosporium fusiforme]